MARSGFKILILTIIFAASVFLLNRYLIRDRFSFSPAADSSGRFFGLLNYGQQFITQFLKFGKTAEENIILREENQKLIQRQAELEYLQNENFFLKKALEISERMERQVVTASIFSASAMPSRTRFLINKGSSDGIESGDVVILESGVLVGVITNVFNDFSQVMILSDPQFKTTAKVLNSKTAGLTRGDGDKVYLDMIVQSDEIAEGDTVVSTGDDLIPPALIIGTVTQVDASASKIFKKVRIDPAFANLPFGKVIIVK